MVTTARRRTRRQKAPPPPKTGTGRHWGRGWRQHRGPLYDRNGNPLPPRGWTDRLWIFISPPHIWRKHRRLTVRMKRQRRAQRTVYKTRTRYTRRRVRRRGLTYALAGCLAGGLALAWSGAEFGLSSLATDLFALAEITSAGTAWWWSKHPPKWLGQQPPPPASSRSRPKAAPRPGSGGHRCGATTKIKKKSCEMRVASPGQGCRFHPGGTGKSAGGSKSRQSGGKADTP
jgi:hypothetical protein